MPRSSSEAVTRAAVRSERTVVSFSSARSAISASEPRRAPIGSSSASARLTRHDSPAPERRRLFREGEIEWLRPDGEPMANADWTNPEARAVAVTASDGAFLLLVNGWWEPLEFTLPQPLRPARFSVAVDTSQGQPPAAISPVDVIRLEGRSVVLLRQMPHRASRAD